MPQVKREPLYAGLQAAFPIGCRVEFTATAKTVKGTWEGNEWGRRVRRTELARPRSGVVVGCVYLFEGRSHRGCGLFDDYEPGYFEHVRTVVALLIAASYGKRFVVMPEDAARVEVAS